MERNYKTNYRVATQWMNNSYVMCNHIAEIDCTVYDNIRFSLEDEDGDPIEIYQWFITDCSKDDVCYLEEAFGLHFTFSELLDCYILCVPHWGTSWDYVYWTTSNKYAERELGEPKNRA